MATTSTNFASILDQSPDHVELPKQLPEGSYSGTVGAVTYDKSKQKGTAFARWSISNINPIEPPKSMSEEEFLAAIDAAGGTEGKILDHTIYITDKNAFRFPQFHEHCGLNLKVAGTNRSRNDSVMNADVGFIVEHQFPDGADKDDPEAPRFARIARTFSLSD